jgi:transcriptional regulator with XRE-family HTH domain
MGESGEGLAGWLAEQMRVRGLSQRQLAQYSGVSVATISRILNEGHVPRAEVVARLAEYFGAPAVDALTQAGLATLDAPPEARAEALELLRRLYALDASDRQGILHQLTEILDFLERGPSEAGARGPRPLAMRRERRPRRRDARARR